MGKRVGMHMKDFEPETVTTSLPPKDVLKVTGAKRKGMLGVGKEDVLCIVILWVTCKVVFIIGLTLCFSPFLCSIPLSHLYGKSYPHFA